MKVSCGGVLKTTSAISLQVCSNNAATIYPLSTSSGTTVLATIQRAKTATSGSLTYSFEVKSDQFTSPSGCPVTEVTATSSEAAITVGACTSPASTCKKITVATNLAKPVGSELSYSVVVKTAGAE